jgi:hypothetical protein
MDPMDNRHFIDDNGPIRWINENRLLEDSVDPISIDDAFLIDFIDPKAEGRIERRRHKRIKVDKYAVSLIRSATSKSIKIQGRSMGDIACSVFRSKPVRIGRINNISMDGLMFRHVDSKKKSSESLVLDILSLDCGFYLGNIRFRSISDFAIAEDFSNSSIKMRQFQLEFERLSNAQTDQLEYFMWKVLAGSKKNWVNDAEADRFVPTPY